MNIHILIPFYRKKLAKTLTYYWEQQQVFWYPLMAPSDYVEFPKTKWVRPTMVSELKKGDNCFVKIDEFRDTQKIIADDYYGVACDETIYEPGFMDVLRQQTAKVVVCSSYRGDKTPPGGIYTGPPTVCVVTSLSQLKRNIIGMGQYFVKGEVFKEVPYAGDGIKSIPGSGIPTHKGGRPAKTIKIARDDDGHYIVELKRRYPNDIVLMTNWYSFANYLQFGRWNTTNACIKPNWELPKYIDINIEKEKDTLHL